MYTQALAGAPEDKTLYANRCLARLKWVEKQEKEEKKEKKEEEVVELALADAEKALELDSTWLKGYHRKAACLVALGRWKEAKPYLLR